MFLLLAGSFCPPLCPLHHLNECGLQTLELAGKGSKPKKHVSSLVIVLT